MRCSEWSLLEYKWRVEAHASTRISRKYWLKCSRVEGVESLPGAIAQCSWLCLMIGYLSVSRPLASTSSTLESFARDTKRLNSGARGCGPPLWGLHRPPACIEVTQ